MAASRPADGCHDSLGLQDGTSGLRGFVRYELSRELNQPVAGHDEAECSKDERDGGYCALMSAGQHSHGGADHHEPHREGRRGVGRSGRRSRCRRGAARRRPSTSSMRFSVLLFGSAVVMGAASWYWLWPAVHAIFLLTTPCRKYAQNRYLVSTSELLAEGCALQRRQIHAARTTSPNRTPHAARVRGGAPSGRVQLDRA
jgi:hypothetical protein